MRQRRRGRKYWKEEEEEEEDIIWNLQPQGDYKNEVGLTRGRVRSELYTRGAIANEEARLLTRKTPRMRLLLTMCDSLTRGENERARERENERDIETGREKGRGASVSQVVCAPRTIRPRLECAYPTTQPPGNLALFLQLGRHRSVEACALAVNR